MTDYATWTDEQVDIAIMGRLFGWTDVAISEDKCWRLFGEHPRRTARPTQSADAMLDVISTMGKRGWYVALTGPRWSCSFERGNQFVMAHALMAQRAVAIAALMALDAEER